MSALAWEILRVMVSSKASYWAAWNIGQIMGLGAIEFHWQYPQTDEDRAMKELIDKGLVEELPDLGQRFRLIVREK